MFKREISDISAFAAQLNSNPFLHKIYTDLIRSGKALLTFRDNTATIYYQGGQLCHMDGPGFEPEVCQGYLPLLRSKVLSSQSIHSITLTKGQWLHQASISSCSFCSVLPEILDNIQKDRGQEGIQVSCFYQFSPLRNPMQSKVVLLDIEAAFKNDDRIDLVLYHTEECRLVFVEVKRLHDSRCHDKAGGPAEVLGQLDRYEKIIAAQKQKIITAYNNVIDYYNQLSGRKMPPIKEVSPKPGLLLVEFTADSEDQQLKKAIVKEVTDNNFPVYPIGNAERATEKTIEAIYKKFK